MEGAEDVFGDYDPGLPVPVGLFSGRLPGGSPVDIRSMTVSTHEKHSTSNLNNQKHNICYVKHQ